MAMVEIATLQEGCFFWENTAEFACFFKPEIQNRQETEMQIECAYCGTLTEAIPYCDTPMCAACCQTCRLVNGGCPALREERRKAQKSMQKTG